MVTALLRNVNPTSSPMHYTQTRSAEERNDTLKDNSAAFLTDNEQQLPDDGCNLLFRCWFDPIPNAEVYELISCVADCRGISVQGKTGAAQKNAQMCTYFKSSTGNFHVGFGLKSIYVLAPRAEYIENLQKAGRRRCGRGGGSAASGLPLGRITDLGELARLLG